MELFLYLAKVSACLAIFYFFYYVLLSKLTFFSFNRWYLIGTLVLSFIIPILSISVERKVTVPTAIFQQNKTSIAVSNAPSNAIDPEFMGDSLATTSNQFSLQTMLMVIYALVFAFFMIRFLIGIVSILLKSRNYKYRGKLRYVAVSPDCNFKNSSFHHYLFIDESLSDTVKKQVIHHEELHIQFFHFIDKLMAGLSTAILWFNPFAYAYLHAIDANHEFEVDAKSTLNFDKKSYANLILNLAQPSNNLLINHFSKLPLKRRMAMLFKNPTNRMKKLIYVSVLPLIAICCVAFIKQKEVMVYVKSSVSPSEISSVQQPEKIVNKEILKSKESEIINEKSVPDNIYKRELMTYVEVNQPSRINPVNFAIEKPVIKKQRVLVIDAGHGGKDGATKSIAGLLEKDLNLRAAVILKEEAEKRGIRVIMTREKDEFISLSDRVKFQTGADAFISVHHNSMPLNKKTKLPESKNGFRGVEVYTSQSPIKQSINFANDVLYSLKNLKGLPVKDSVEIKNIYVVREAIIPSVLIEFANISYQEGCDFISEEANVRKICNLILDGYEKLGC